MRAAAGAALSGAGLTLAALTFGVPSLFVPGVAFVLLGVLAPAWAWAAARATHARHRVSVARAVEQEPVEVVVEVRRNALALPGVEVLDALAAAPLPLRTRWRGPRETDEAHLLTSFPSRGWQQLRAPTVVGRDPLKLSRWQAPGEGPGHRLLILPRVEPVQWPRRGEGDAPDAMPGEPPAAVDVDGLRPYRPGTSASRIHWPALARGGELLERRLRADGDALPLILLDAAGQPAAEDLDAAVRAAASLALDLARRGGCRVLLPGARAPVQLDPDLSRWPSLHARLAVVAPEGDEGRREARRPRAGTVFHVAARPPVRLVSGGATVLVLPEDQHWRAPAPVCLRVCGCRGLAVGARRRLGTPAARVA